jgi:hypothetical protein
MSNSDIPPTDFDEVETQDEQDAVFGVDRPAIVDVPDEDDGA